MTATVDVPPPAVPLKANRRSVLGRLFGRKNKNQTEGEDSIERRGKAAKGARASKKVNKKKEEATPAGEDREPEAAKNVAKTEEKVVPKPEEPKAETAPTDAPVDAPTEKVVPETVEEEETTDEENTASTAEDSPEKEEDKAEGAEGDKEDEGKETPDSEEPKGAEEMESAAVQSGDDSTRDQPNLAKQAALFCGCI